MKTNTSTALPGNLRGWNLWHGARNSIGGFVGLLRDRTVLTFAVLFLFATVGLFWLQSRQSSRLVEMTAIQHASRYSKAVSEFRTLYSSEVVQPATKHGMLATHDYQGKEGAIPLPATLSMLLGNRLGEIEGGGQTRLVSPYPFPWRRKTGGLKDDFSQQAWVAVNRNPEKPFYRFQNENGHPTLRYAVADRMRSSCIDCHNTHPDTPKNDWQVGDVRGILEVSLPMEQATAQAETALYGSWWGVAGMCILGFSCVLLVIHRQQEESRRLEQRVSDRTQKLQSLSKKQTEMVQLLERDLTERKQLQAELAHAHKLEAVGQLAAGIAHEINTPTQYVGDNTRFLKDAFTDIGLVLDQFEKLLSAAKNGPVEEKLLVEVDETLKQADVEYLKEEVPQAIDQSLDGVERVAKIVRAMKEFSHPGNEEKSLVNLAEAIETTITVARNEWKYVAELETQFDPDLPEVSCLPGEMNQVFLNLIVNAAHAISDTLGEESTEKGTITVGTRCDGAWVEIFVRDTGTGIPEEVRAKIFDPFFTTKEVGRGTGQGLAIVRSVVTDKHGGTIECETEQGKGTTFIVRLPIGNSGQRAESCNSLSQNG